MNRRHFLGSTLLLCGAPVALAQSRPAVVGLLWNDSVRPSPYIATLTAALRDRGLVEGANLRLVDSVALEGYAPMADNAAALVRAKVDLIVAYGATATLAVAKATKDIPIVAIMGADPVASGLAASFSRPGGNVTGIWTLAIGVAAKRMELLNEVAPKARTVGVVYAPGTNVQAALREIEAAAQLLKVKTIPQEIGKPEDIEAGIAALAKGGVTAIYVVTSTMLAAYSARVVAAVAKHRLPAIYGVERYADAGGLLVYAPSIHKAFRRAAVYVDRILKGARPGEMAIEQANDVELVISLKTASAQGIRIPAAVLQRADRAN